MLNKKQDVSKGRSPLKKKDKAKNVTDSGTVVPYGALGGVLIRNEFYRNGYRVLQRLVTLQLLAMLILVGALIHVIDISQPEDTFYATTEDGRAIKMEGLYSPNLSRPALVSWAAQAATEVMTFGFNDYRRRMQVASSNFTKDGWTSFTNAINASGLLDNVEKNQQILTAAPRDIPSIVSEGVVRGRYQWTIRLPLNVRYQSSHAETGSTLNITLVVVRVPDLGAPHGIAIDQWISY